MPVNIQSYTVADFIEWDKRNQLRLSPDFQRGAVWAAGAKSYLIDTILNDYPIPQVYFRTIIDPITQSTIREVVDGQQRLRAILEFASGKFRLGAKSDLCARLDYDSLDVEAKSKFLAFEVPSVQLVNAEDEKVLEVFARLNSYSVSLNPAELRHSTYSQPVKLAIYEAANDWSKIWSELGVLTLRERVRFNHYSVMAELFMIVDIGYGSAGEGGINKYYMNMKDKPEIYFVSLRETIDCLLKNICERLGESFRNTDVFSAPNFLALFAAVGLLEGKVPRSGAAEGVEISNSGVNWDKTSDVLRGLAQAFEEDIENTGPYRKYIEASKSTTHRIPSRRNRLEFLLSRISDE